VLRRHEPFNRFGGLRANGMTRFIKIVSWKHLSPSCISSDWTSLPSFCNVLCSIKTEGFSDFERLMLVMRVENFFWNADALVPQFTRASYPAKIVELCFSNLLMLREQLVCDPSFEMFRPFFEYKSAIVLESLHLSLRESAKPFVPRPTEPIFLNVLTKARNARSGPDMLELEVAITEYLAAHVQVDLPDLADLIVAVTKEIYEAYPRRLAFSFNGLCNLEVLLNSGFHGKVVTLRELFDAMIKSWEVPMCDSFLKTVRGCEVQTTLVVLFPFKRRWFLLQPVSKSKLSLEIGNQNPFTHTTEAHSKFLTQLAFDTVSHDPELFCNSGEMVFNMPGVLDRGGVLRQWMTDIQSFLLIEDNKIFCKTKKGTYILAPMVSPKIARFLACLVVRSLRMTVNLVFTLEPSCLDLLLSIVPPTAQDLDDYFDGHYEPLCAKYFEERFYHSPNEFKSLSDCIPMPDSITLTSISSISNVFKKADDEPPASWDGRLDFRKRFEQQARQAFFESVTAFRSAFALGIDYNKLAFLEDKSLLLSGINPQPMPRARILGSLELAGRNSDKTISNLLNQSNLPFSEVIIQILEALADDEALLARLLIMWTGSKSLIIDEVLLSLSCVTPSPKTHTVFVDYSFAQSDSSQRYMTTDKYRKFLQKIAQLQHLQLSDFKLDKLVSDQTPIWTCKAMICSPLLMIPLMPSTLQLAKSVALFLNMSEDMNDVVGIEAEE